ncbi:quinoprotein amine dehydrogenase beta chain-like protein [Purpureocillium lavendulum]|uniref:Quinoprotein amine dehydrogenase beta chain-like protein n=1 Tax=Purpureocillium lavendulum TaxID=1247861 RepID=A0AB34G2E0_9HYPO|nr:quinoprotein amine dehydrogenase beta chain-like protein [Purpureocillium lavendulum]
MRSLILAVAPFLAAAASVRSVTEERDPFCPKPVETRVVYQFPNSTWAENLAVRTNGNILVNILSEPAIYEVNPYKKPPTATLVHRFDEYSSLFGIAEVAADVFAVAMGNFSLMAPAKPGSWAVWKVDMNGAEAEVSKVAGIVEAELLNGMTVLDKHSQTVLVGDSALGAVFRVDTRTGKYQLTIQDDKFKPPPNSRGLGVNGVRYTKPYLYYTNTFGQVLGRVPVDCNTGKATGAIEEINGDVGYDLDDFARDKRGNTYIGAGFTNDIVCVGSNGTAVSVAGGPGQTTILGPTAMVWGQTKVDKNTLYLSTSGDKGSNNGLGGAIVALVMPQ